MSDDFFKDINFSELMPSAGRILLSEPFLFDPNFKRSVILLTEHNEEGTVGFILNRPMDLSINDAIAEFPKMDKEIFHGGPVSQDSLFFLHKLGDKIEHSQEILPGLYWGGDFDQLKTLIDLKQATEEDVRFFVGYSGWSPGQLDDEIKERSWIVAKCTVQQVMDAKEKDFWKDIMKSLGKKYAVMASFPEDPSLN
jgi:putative transcriptional regulator